MSSDTPKTDDSKVVFRTQILRSGSFGGISVSAEVLEEIRRRVEDLSPVSIFYGGWTPEHHCGLATDPAIDGDRLMVTVEIDKSRLPAVENPSSRVMVVGVVGKVRKYEDRLIHKFDMEGLALTFAPLGLGVFGPSDPLGELWFGGTQ